MRKALTYGVFFIACGASIGTVDGGLCYQTQKRQRVRHNSLLARG